MRFITTKILSVLIGLLSSVILFFFYGVPTAVIENRGYYRMTPTTNLDIFFLVAISILFGIFIGLQTYIFSKKMQQKEQATYGIVGTVGSFFAISCPTCISILVALFGSAFLMQYYNPLRPFIGFLSIGLVIFGIYKSVQRLRNNCSTCIPS